MAVEKQTSPPPPPPQWVIDLSSPAPARSKASSNIPDPPGFSSKKQKQVSTHKPPTQTEHDTLLLKKAWELSFQPAKSIPMNAIMMYMSGNSLQIFSIMMVFMLFKTPIQGLMNTNQAFSRFERSDRIHGKLLGVKIVYCVMQLALLAMGVWKVDRMGLLPTTRSDWLAWEGERGWRETVGFAF